MLSFSSPWFRGVGAHPPRYILYASLLIENEAGNEDRRNFILFFYRGVAAPSNCGNVYGKKLAFALQVTID